MDIEWKKIKRVVTGNASEQEKNDVEVWKKEDLRREVFIKDATSYYEKGFPIEDVSSKDVDKAWQRVRKRIPKQRRVVVYVKRWIAGAAVLAGVILGIWLLLFKPEREVSRERMPLGVQLILADGTTHPIQTDQTVSEGIPGFEVNEQDGLKQLEKKQESPEKQEIAYNEIIVPRGADYQLTLADGTRVMLNSDSRIRFPDEFQANERRVYIQGEVYFKVAHDEDCPFFVETGVMTVRVLGTEFNVKAYAENEVMTTLVSGRVMVKRGLDSLTLAPGEQCEVDKQTGLLTVKEADLVTTLAWKNGEFVFKNVTSENMINELSRWYDMEVVYESEALKDDRYYIYVERSKTLEEVLDKVTLTGNMKYRIDGKKVIISRQ